jgi:hypothetical protein
MGFYGAYKLKFIGEVTVEHSICAKSMGHRRFPSELGISENLFIYFRFGSCINTRHARYADMHLDHAVTKEEQMDIELIVFPYSCRYYPLLCPLSGGSKSTHQNQWNRWAR